MAVSVIGLINEVNAGPLVSTWMGGMGKPSRYVVSQLGQLSLPSLWGR